MTITVIEEVCAVEYIDEISARSGIDVLFIGTSDLSFSLGLRGRQNRNSRMRSTGLSKPCAACLHFFTIAGSRCRPGDRLDHKGPRRFQNSKRNANCRIRGSVDVLVILMKLLLVTVLFGFDKFTLLKILNASKRN
jgi:hypothetical protein